jgi:Family of unknown function (DUF6682)
MAALDTVGQYLEEARRLLQDEITPYRYPDDDLVDALNMGLLEARRLRADLFLPLFEIPWLDPTKTAPGTDLTQPVTMDPMYRPALVYYIVGRAQLRDDESTTDQRAAGLMTKFTAQLLTIQS